MSIEQHGETPEHKAKREANTKRMETQPADLLAGRTVPPSPDLCACGHGRAMHFDEDGDHNGPCLWQVHSDAPFCKCDMWHRKPGEDEFLGVPVSEWNQIRAEINCRRGPDGSLLKRFRELLEVSDMRAALLKKRGAPSSKLVEAADAMRTWTDNFLAGVKAKNGLFVSGPGHTQALNKMLRAVEAYDAARHAEGAQPSGPDRCEVCDWPLAESREKGCVPGDCSYRPEQGSDEWHRIRARREALKAQPSGAPAPAPASAQGEVCEKCGGAGWVWGHELPTPEETPTDTRYSCPVCQVLLIYGTPPSIEKNGEAHHQSHVAPPNSATASSPASPASEVKACPFCDHPMVPREVEPGLWNVFDTNFQCHVYPHLLLNWESKAAAIAAWNRRSPAPSPASGESARTASKDASKELDELLAVFAKGDDDDEDCWTQPARRAQLYVASLRAEVERLEKRVTNLLSGTVESFEDGTLTILPHREMTTRMASALAGILDECEAPNYVQMILSRAGEPGEPRKRYVVTVQRPEGKTPHQLREDAEKERDALRAEVDRLRTEHARLIAVINDDGSLENIDDIVSIAEDAMHAYNVQNKLIEEVERLRALMNTIRSNDRSEKYEIGEQRRDGATPIAGTRFQTPREIVDMEEQRAANALRTALGAKETK